MKLPNTDFLAPLFIAFGLFGAVAVFVSETHSFRDAVCSWAKRDLESRTELASSTLREAIETADFRRIHEFGSSCAADGVRLTVFSAPGGMVFDSVGKGNSREVYMFATRPCGEYRVRLGLPVSRVLAPYKRARIGFLFAALTGGTGVLFVLFFTFRQRSRMRELARERDSQRKLVAELQKVEAFRRDFIADVSHEIKTPLTGIIGSVDLLSSAENLPCESRGRLLAMLKSQSERLNALVQGILSLARLERDAERARLDFSRVDLTDIVCDVVERLRTTAEAKCLSVKADIPESCIAFCDAQLVDSAISNLLANAIRHSGSVEVFLSLSSSDGMFTVSVEDHGCGIPPEDRSRVFDRFYRVDRSRGIDTGGTGLGLAIVREVARIHGGDVRLEGVEPSGCRFLFSAKLNPDN